MQFKYKRNCFIFSSLFCQNDHNNVIYLISVNMSRISTTYTSTTAAAKMNSLTKDYVSNIN